MNAVTCAAPVMGENFLDADGIAYTTADLTITVSNAVAAEHVLSGGGGGAYGALAVLHYGTISQSSTSQGMAVAGLYAGSGDGSVSITSGGAIGTSSNYVSGIFANGGAGALATTFDGTAIETAGRYAHGIAVYSAGGNVEVESGTVITLQGYGADGISAFASGGLVTVTTSAASSITSYGAYGEGIAAGSNAAITIESNGAITTWGNGAGGIVARNTVAGQLISITSTARIQTGGLGSAGIDARAYRFSDGISSDIEIAVTADVELREGLADAIHAYAEIGDVTVTVGSGVAITTNSVDATMTGAAGAAIFARGVDVGIYSDGSLKTYGDGGTGIYASGDIVTVTTTGSVATTGADADGIYAAGFAVYLDSGATIDTSGAGATGIVARSYYHQEITLRTTLDTAGTSASGIDAATFIGNLRITTQAAGDITLQQGGGTGIFARSSYGGVTADLAGDVRVTQGAGIDLAATGGAPLDIDLSGKVTAGLAGLVAATGGLLTFDSTAAASVETSSGLAAAVSLSGDTVQVANAGIIDGGAAGLAIVSVTDTTLGNSGLIGAGLDLAIDASGAASLDLLQNSGTLRGFLRLGGSDTTLDNQSGGLFLLQDRADRAADADFGAGTDAFENRAGAVVRLAALAGGTESASLLGLERFENFGRVTLADIEAGAALAEAGDSLTLSGDFISQGGTLALDVVLGDSSSAADLLHVGGNVTAPGGPTLLEVVNAGGLGAQTAGNGILVVQVDGSSAAGAFALDGGPLAVNSFSYDLVQQADGNWYLVSTEDAAPPPPPVVQTPVPDYRALASGALELPHGLTDALHQRLGELRHFLRQDAQSATLGADDAGQMAVRPGAGGAMTDGLWLRGLGSGVTYDGDAGLGFRQDSSGLQAGFDLGFQDAIGDGDTLLLGGFGGLLTASGDIAASDAEFSIESYGFGLYGTWLQPEGLYLDAVATLSFLDLEQVTPQVDARLDTTGITVTGSLEAGYHVALGQGLFLEPQAQFYYARAFLDDATDSQGNRVTFDDSQSLQGRLGARGGATFDVGVNGRLTPYLDVSVVQEFLGESRVVTGAADQRNDLSGRALELGLGLEAAALASNLSLHVDADWIHGQQTEGFRVVAGLRLTW
jgi:outer membrane autotransporter protein